MSQLAFCFVCKTPGVRYQRDENDGWADSHDTACEILELKGWRSFAFKQPDWNKPKLYLVCPICATKISKNYQNVAWLNRPWLDTNKFVPDDMVIEAPRMMEDEELMAKIKSLSFDQLLDRIRKLAQFYKGDKANVDE